MIIPIVSGQYLVDALGGYEKLDQLSDQLGIDLRWITRHEEVRGPLMDYSRQFSSVGSTDKKLVIVYINYDSLFPDIYITLSRGWVEKENKKPRYEQVKTIILSNIGLFDETPEDSKQKIKAWFEQEVTPLILQYVFL